MQRIKLCILFFKRKMMKLKLVFCLVAIALAGFTARSQQSREYVNDSTIVEKIDSTYFAEDGSHVRSQTTITWKILPNGEKQKVSESREISRSKVTDPFFNDTDIANIEDFFPFEAKPEQNHNPERDYGDYVDAFKNVFGNKDKFEATWAGLEFAYKNWQTKSSLYGKSDYALEGGWMFRWNFFDIEIPLASNIGFFTGLGYESSIYYLKNPISFLVNITFDPLWTSFPIDYRYIEDARLVSRYINLPLFFEVQSKNKNFSTNVGVILGLNVYNRFKNDYSNRDLDMSSSVKLDNRFEINRFKADLSLRFAFKKIQIVGEYALVSMFDTKFAKVYPYSIGLNLAF